MVTSINGVGVVGGFGCGIDALDEFRGKAISWRSRRHPGHHQDTWNGFKYGHRNDSLYRAHGRGKDNASALPGFPGQHENRFYYFCCTELHRDILPVGRKETRNIPSG